MHPSLLPEQTLQNELVDIVVVGEGERTIQDLAICLLNQGDLSSVRGIVYKKEGRAIINPPQELIDLNTLDMDLPYELLGKAFYDPTAISVHTSRGCPHRCSFCYSPAFNKRKYRQKNAEKVVEEVQYLHKNTTSKILILLTKMNFSLIFKGLMKYSNLSFKRIENKMDIFLQI